MFLFQIEILIVNHSNQKTDIVGLLDLNDSFGERLWDRYVGLVGLS